MIKVYVVYDNPKKQEQILVETLQIEKKPRHTGDAVGTYYAKLFTKAGRLIEEGEFTSPEDAAVHELVGAAYRVISPQYCSWLFYEPGDTWKTSCGHIISDSFLIKYCQCDETGNYKKIIPFAACPFCGRIPQNRGTLTVWIERRSKQCSGS
jgi:hypothetical protein